MNCHRVVNLMSAYVDGELTGEEMLSIRRHMATCPECSEEHESILITKRALSNLVTAQPRHDFAAAILAQLDEVAVPKHQRFLDWFLRVLHEKLSPVAAALAVSGAALVIMSAGEVEKLAPASTAVSASSVPVPRVSFMKGVSRDSGVLASAPPLKLVDRPVMEQSQIRFTSFTTE
jgi:anti-sigma factor RsiW